jgi:hypothetical protein
MQRSLAQLVTHATQSSRLALGTIDPRDESTVYVHCWWHMQAIGPIAIELVFHRGQRIR